MRTAVAIMAKAPRPGEVKTRLAAALGATQAADLYRCFLLDGIEQVRALEAASLVIAYAPADGRGEVERLAPGFTPVPQEGADLGARLANLFERLLANGHEAALVVGSDLPTLPAAFLRQALALVGTPGVDVVLGPSEDGGYYLIGLRVLHRSLFEGIAWSTPAVLAGTIERAEAAGLRTACLPPWFDVDTPEDLERLKASLAETEGPEPRHTRRFLMEHRR
jgi:rSAM/selenodomain-associated transferase 1